MTQWIKGAGLATPLRGFFAVMLLGLSQYGHPDAANGDVGTRQEADPSTHGVVADAPADDDETHATHDDDATHDDAARGDDATHDARGDARHGNAAAHPNVADLTLWLWHGEHDLRGLRQASGGRIAVAYLARTLLVGAGRVRAIPRHDAIYLDDETARTAVVHVELVPGTTADELAALESEILSAIEPVFRENASGIQIDFDAPRSFRTTYARLLHAIAENKPPAHVLSMTAIGSWCMEDRWLADVPVDGVVPMLFGPGHEREMAISALGHGPLREARCNQALGIREGDPRPPRAERLYVFRQGGWTLERAMGVWEQTVMVCSAQNRVAQPQSFGPVSSHRTTPLEQRVPSCRSLQPRPFLGSFPRLARFLGSVLPVEHPASPA